MRVLFEIAIVTVVAATVWSSNPTVAKHTDTVSIDPTSITATVTNLPTEQYDAF
ncbi:MAG: hypothetical protein WCF66_00175 [Pseudolabrys sp.]|jgi:hypothetical protein